MSVIVTLRVSGDPATFEQQVAAQAAAIGHIMEIRSGVGVVARRRAGLCCAG